MIIKALTISQPFASLIASGEKWVENRVWPTTYRGLLAIHAGKGMQYLSKEVLKKYPTGKVVAVASLVAVERKETILRNGEDGSCSWRIPGTSRTWFDVYCHQHTEGPFCWILENVIPLEQPIEAKGSQGLWDWELPEDFRIREVLS